MIDRPLLEAEVFARDASGARQRVRHLTFPAYKTLEDFDFSAQPSAEKPLVLHLAPLAWNTEAANVCLTAPPGTGKTHLSIELGINVHAGHRVAFATAQQWSPDWKPPKTATRSTTNCDNSNATTADRRRDRLPPPGAPSREPASSRSSRAATNAAQSSSPATAASRPGATSSATPWSPPPSSTASSTTPP